MKSFLISFLIFGFSATIAFFVWNFLPQWERHFVFFLVLLSAFFLIRALFSDVLGFLFSHFSSFFVFVLSGVSVVLAGIWAYGHLFPKTPLENSIADSFDSALMAMKTPKEEVSKEELLAMLESDSSLGAEEKQYWKSSLESLGAEQKAELKKMLEKKIAVSASHHPQASQHPQSSHYPQYSQTPPTPLVFYSSQASPAPSVAHAQSPQSTHNPQGVQASQSPQASADIHTGTWKKPVIKETVAVSSSVPALLVSAGESHEKSRIVFEKTNAQIIFPKEYQVSGIVFGKNLRSEESVAFSLNSPENVRAFVTVSLFTTGEKYAQYAQQQYSSNPQENIFFVSEKNANNITYTTFFNGVLWDIHIALPFVAEPSADDFYNILLPMVFEEKDT